MGKKFIYFGKKGVEKKFEKSFVIQYSVDVPGNLKEKIKELSP